MSDCDGSVIAPPRADPSDVERESSGAADVPEPRDRDDVVLAESERSRVVRRFLPSGSVICKQWLGADSSKRAHREASILERLSAVSGVSKLAAAQRGDFVLLEDEHAVALSEVVRPGKLEIDAVLRIALELASTIGEMHVVGIVHRDINPSNILLAERQSRVILIDFDIASSFAEERPAFTSYAEIVGSLPYVAPEQTGRTGRTSDQRADLYALGVTLYELSTGRLPFESADTLSLIRDHLAREAIPPAIVDARVPQSLSDMIVRLLQKEPARRYQSAAGLASDLTRLIERRAAGDRETFALGERDFPLRIMPPSRLIGRQAEIAMLHTAFADAMAGRCNGLFVAGAPGVGKTVLIDELRTIVTEHGGWYVTSKFDQFQQSVESSAGRLAFRRLISLILAEPEAELAAIRTRILAKIGSSAPTAAGIIPELAILLRVAGEPIAGDPNTMQARIAGLELDLLRSIASPQRPVVYVLDDLQWATPATLAFLDAVVSETPVPGVLLIGAYRAADVDAAHPLSAMLLSWKRSFAPPQRMQLANLPPGDLCELLREMLRLPQTGAMELARAVGARTNGNPYDTVELIDGLRRDGALRPGPRGWTWDPATIRKFIGEGDVVDLLNERLNALPVQSCGLLEIMACLGGDVPGTVLEIAADVDAAQLESDLLPSLNEGLILTANAAGRAFRFRHDRVQQAAYGRLEDGGIPLRLSIARRLAAAGTFELLAAQQYLAAVEALHDPQECSGVVALFRMAAQRSAETTNYASAERFISAALALLDVVRSDDDALVALLRIDQHATLFALGRLDEADEVYRSIELHSGSPLDLVESACVHISSLTNRNRPYEAIEAGLQLLAQIGFALPDRDGLAQAVDARVDTIYAFAAGVTDPRAQAQHVPSVVAAATIIRRIMPAAFFSNQRTLASWLVIESLILWESYGPRASLVGPISLACYVTSAMKDDYAVGYRVARRILGESEARGYEPQTSYSRFLFALGVEHWFEPAENCVAQARRAHDGLLRSGELHLACHSYYAIVPLLLESSETLDEYAGENEAALALCRRTANDQSAQLFMAYRQLARTLLGETFAEGSFTDGSFDEDEHLAMLDANPMAAGYFHLLRAYSALFFGQAPALIQHAEAAMARYSTTTAVSASVLTHLLFALAAARQCRDARPQERSGFLERLDSSRDFLHRRAHDAPDIRHLVDFIDAERAWVLDDFVAAGVAFEAALRSARSRKSSAHLGLISERAAELYLEHGLDRYARLLLNDARDAYAKWGAPAKTRQIERTYGSLLESGEPARLQNSRTTVVSSDSIDMLGILRASQALSSQTSAEQLQDCVAELLASLTGATSVLLAVRGDGAEEWSLPSSGADAAVSVDVAGARGLLPLTVFRFVERTHESVIIADAARDERFPREPYFARVDMCSMLVVPILSRGVPRAILILENRLGCGAFSTERLDAVKLIAGQLAVSLDNALLYASLEQKVAERTDALAAANAQLELLGLTDALTGLSNRRGFDNKLETEWLRAGRSKTALGLAMIDVDEFKKYNDCYGHPAGDACLRRIATVLGSGLRVGNDLAARYGGEEFVLILPDTSLAGTYRVAERIRGEIAALAEPHIAAMHGVVTVSVGVAALVPGAGSDAAACIRNADLALYEAKRRGRNRVVCFGLREARIFEGDGSSAAAAGAASQEARSAS